jgi:RNA polymerase-binding transcription factor DksA
MKKIREKLEKQKTILLLRLNKEPNTAQMQLHRLKPPRRFNRKLRKTLLFARAEQQMKDVEDAIERLNDGVYGQCVVCGEPIQLNRLEALPTATHCWSCQHETP